MKFTYRKALLAGAFALGSVPIAGIAQAQETDEDAVQETVFVTGSRGAPRTLTDSPVPVDVFSEEDITAISFTDTNDILRTLVPSYTLSRQPISDGASFIRPAQLRGLPTDKTLVLVNSKRRHRAALVQIGGPGVQGPDIATIPAAALKTVEVLRDGASAQYGSDAIAGVINFILKDNPEGGTLQFDIGQYYEGDGETVTVSGNLGIPLGDKGFVSISGEISDQNATVRAEQYCESFSCVDVNSPDFLTGVDTTVTFFDLDTYIASLPDANIGEGDVVQPWGVPNATAMRFFVNAGYEISENMELYGFGNVSDSKSDGSFFHRDPGNGTIEDVRLEDGSLWSPLAIYPGGFTPRFNGDVIDYSAVGGIKGLLDNGFGYDLSARYGYSEIEYRLDNTINPSLGPDSPTSFQPGDLSNEEFQLQADFTQEFEIGLESPLLFAFGASYLDEGYEIIQGGEASYIDGPFALPDPFGFCETDMMGAFTGNVSAAGQAVIDNGSTLSCADSDMDGDFDAEDDAVFRVVGVGSNGFPGYSPAFSEEYTRDSYGLYAEASADVTDRLFLQGAVRFEDYSDFGSETVYKLAGQFDITDAIGLRGSVGTGFRAPTPGQQGTTNVSTRLPNGFPVAVGLFPASGPVAQALGAEDLKPELSTNYTIGATGAFDDFSITIDYYRIELEDRLNAISTQDVSTDPTAGAAYDNFLALQGAGVVGAESIGGVFYFTNAFDTVTEGIDIVATYSKDWANGQSTDFTASMNFNETEFDSEVDEFFNEEAQFDFLNRNPEYRGVFTVSHDVGPFNILGRANYYGPYENAQITSSTNVTQEFGEEVLFDLEATYSVNETLDLTFGARNIFDEYPDEGEIGETCCGRIYRSDSIVDWQGGYYYARAIARF